ncbi:hypothetical protein D3C74_472420 [compost metagenome]
MAITARINYIGPVRSIQCKLSSLPFRITNFILVNLLQRLGVERIFHIKSGLRIRNLPLVIRFDHE